MVVDVDHPAARRIDETMVGGDQQPGIAAAQPPPQLAEMGIKRSQRLLCLAAVGSVTVRVGIEIGIIGINVARLELFLGKLADAGEDFGQGAIGDALRTARVPGVEGAAGNTLWRDHPGFSVQRLKQRLRVEKSWR